MDAQVAFLSLCMLGFCQNLLSPAPTEPSLEGSGPWQEHGFSLGTAAPSASWHRQLPAAASGITPWWKVCHNLLCRSVSAVAALTFGRENKQDFVCLSLTRAAPARPGSDCLYCPLPPQPPMLNNPALEQRVSTSFPALVCWCDYAPVPLQLGWPEQVWGHQVAISLSFHHALLQPFVFLLERRKYFLFQVLALVIARKSSPSPLVGGSEWNFRFLLRQVILASLYLMRAALENSACHDLLAKPPLLSTYLWGQRIHGRPRAVIISLNSKELLAKIVWIKH